MLRKTFLIVFFSNIFLIKMTELLLFSYFFTSRFFFAYFLPTYGFGESVYMLSVKTSWKILDFSGQTTWYKAMAVFCLAGLQLLSNNKAKKTDPALKPLIPSFILGWFCVCARMDYCLQCESQTVPVCCQAPNVPLQLGISGVQL